MSFQTKIFLSLLFWNLYIFGQPRQIPEQMLIADVLVRILPDAQERIAEKIHSLTQHREKYQEFSDRCRLYFPLIEKVLQEEKVPNDFKYLALQESTLLPDIVSKSNAVGFWQFKEMTAKELGITINEIVDERKNIIASTRAAAQYFKKANSLMNNWVYAMLAYHDGLTGAYNKMPRNLQGAKSMEISAQTDLYILHFLAHKIVFEEATRSPLSSVILAEYLEAGGKSWSDLEDESHIQAVMLRQFNKWLNAERVPTDKIYSFILPVPETRLAELTQKLQLNIGLIAQPSVAVQKDTPITSRNYYNEDKSSSYPIITLREKRKVGLEEYEFVIANGLNAIIAAENTTLQKILDVTHKTASQFRRWNNMDISTEIQPSTVYYLQRKKGKAYGDAEFHILKYGETMWQVAQRYGMRLKRLYRYNRLEYHQEPEPGTVLWLKKRRPKGEPEKVLLAIPIKYNPVTSKYESVSPTQEDVTYETPILTPSPQMLENDTAVLHIVQRGETLFGIARAYQVAPSELIELNQQVLPADRTVKEGQLLLIRRKIHENQTTPQIAADPSQNFKTSPQPSRAITTSDGKTLHIVRKGETLSEIVDKYPGVSLQEIVQWNGLTIQSQLKEGDTLIVRRGGNLQTAEPRSAQKPATSTTQKTSTSSPVEQRSTAPDEQPYYSPSLVWQQKGKRHTVQKGETAYSIARKYGISLRELIEWNHLNEKGWVTPGQVLLVEDVSKLNLKEKLKETGGYYTVQQGDNIFSITNRFGITIEELVKWNQLNERVPLAIGQELIVDYQLAKNQPAKKQISVSSNITSGNTSPASLAEKPVGEEAIYHVVENHETLERIASEYGVSVAQIREWNNLSTISSLKKGMKLIVGYQKVKENKNLASSARISINSPSSNNFPSVPLDNNTPPKVRQANVNNQGYYLDEKPAVYPTETPVYHIVERGETLYSISVKHKTTVDKIKKLNNKTDNNLSVGEKIRVR
ncbi:MAG: LysM peptidoglycan-binding domain-containing protein [Cytophagales bacterium]|nr:LysM peptidoglycan-binding domain-containing protein [Cytophagales bacterium]MDW8383809.1 LysM peptidoglycan-binding domain-containing protein [Flammeovirgaceae bacterium]